MKIHREQQMFSMDESLKNLKEVVDRVNDIWYYIRVAAENSNTEPWQINSNATLKIPIRISEVIIENVMRRNPKSQPKQQ